MKSVYFICAKGTDGIMEIGDPEGYRYNQQNITKGYLEVEVVSNNNGVLTIKHGADLSSGVTLGSGYGNYTFGTEDLDGTFTEYNVTTTIIKQIHQALDTLVSDPDIGTKVSHVLDVFKPSNRLAKLKLLMRTIQNTGAAPAARKEALTLLTYLLLLEKG